MPRLPADVSLTEGEKRALFSTLWAMARADGHACQSEQGLLRKLHRELFGDEMKAWVQPPDFAIGTAAGALRSPASRRLLLELLYEMMEVDGLELDDEINLFASCARQIGLQEPEVREAWNQSARAIYERATRDLVQRRFDALGRELVRLRNSLFLEPSCDRAGEQIVRKGLEAFRIG